MRHNLKYFACINIKTQQVKQNVLNDCRALQGYKRPSINEWKVFFDLSIEIVFYLHYAI